METTPQTKFSALSSSPTMMQVKEESYFQKNKKMILVLIALLLIFCGLIAFILYSNRTPMPNSITNPSPTLIIEEDKPVVSTPVTQTPNPVTMPTTKEISFILDEHVRVPGNGDDGYAKKLSFTLTVPSDSTSTAATDDLAQDIVNSDFSLTISDLYEVAGIEHFIERVDLGVLPNIGTQVFRVKEETANKDMIYINGQEITNNMQCVWEAGGVTKEAPCGGDNLTFSGRSFRI
ncbi:MAG: hypothetical protein ABIM99_04795, partial [Candidatus Dojkabacteria bacterium]